MLPAEGATLLANPPQVAAPGVGAAVRHQPAGASSQNPGAASTAWLRLPPEESQQGPRPRPGPGMRATRGPHCRRGAGVPAAPSCAGPCGRPGSEPSLGQLRACSGAGELSEVVYFSLTGARKLIYSVNLSREHALCQALFWDSAVNHTDKNPTRVERNLGGVAGCCPPHRSGGGGAHP